MISWRGEIFALLLIRLARIVAERRNRVAAAAAAADATARECKATAKKKEEELCLLQERWCSAPPADVANEDMASNSNMRICP